MKFSNGLLGAAALLALAASGSSVTAAPVSVGEIILDQGVGAWTGDHGIRLELLEDAAVGANGAAIFRFWNETTVGGNLHQVYFEKDTTGVTYGLEDFFVVPPLNENPATTVTEVGTFSPDINSRTVDNTVASFQAKSAGSPGGGITPSWDSDFYELKFVGGDGNKLDQGEYMEVTLEFLAAASASSGVASGNTLFDTLTGGPDFGFGRIALHIGSLGDDEESSWVTSWPEPVPVPAALPLFLSGLLGLGVMARRRKQKMVAA